ncbi:helix-turn-helix transcriptional regulator [Candidatus Enterovibrio escicola]|uniref:helix-turn-helix transcriptional regulator n=1 Tax=Candidatus Enterovibrio escicola TaxID=1927127 RepID=UPI0012382136|nr:hypothetical protein [Candidatus Enterovibrio escacola]
MNNTNVLIPSLKGLCVSNAQILTEHELSLANCADLASLHALLFPELTAKESECIYLMSTGLQTKEIASLMSIVPRFVQRLMQSSANKFNTNGVVGLRIIYHRRYQDYQLKQTVETNRLLMLILTRLNSSLP